MAAVTGKRRGRRWRGALGGVLLLTAGAFAMLPTPGVSAQTDTGSGDVGSLVAAASAQGVRITYTVPDLFVVTEFIDGGGPVAQATVDSTGRAISFAALPYPGENAVTAPGLASFATGLPVPDYPFYARADHPVQPSSEVKDPSGSYALVATADQGKADGSADFVFGGDKPVSGASADAGALLESDKVRVEAVSISQALNIGEGTLRIGSVTSRSVTSFVAGQEKPDTKTELIIEGAKVGDQAVTIGPDGVHAGGGTAPVPIGSGSESLNQALAQAGITVKTIKGADIEGGAAGDALEITVKHPIPGAENVQGTFVYQIGGATSYIAFGQGGPALPPVGDVPAPFEDTAPAPSFADSPAAGATSDSTTAAFDDVPPSLPAGVAGGPFPTSFNNGSLGLAAGPGDLGGSFGAGTDTGYAAAPSAPPVVGTAQPVALARDFSGTTKTLFIILAVGGALLVSSGAAWRFGALLAAWKA
ncbi:MAG: hypothetical protein ACRD0C_12020 [Acidimicrobiia bacterium]